MEIVNGTQLNPTMLDAVARAALGAATYGVSVGGDRSCIHLKNHNLPDQQRASDVLNHFGVLPLAVSPGLPGVGGAAPVVSADAKTIAGAGALAYLLLRGDEEIRRGQVAVVDGEISLTLSGLEAGTYDVFVYRLDGNFASGVAQIQVDAA